MKTLKNIYLSLLLLYTAGLFAQQPLYYVKEWDKVRLFQHLSLEPAAKAASLICPAPTTAGTLPLKVHSYDLYPIMGATSGDYGLDDEKAAAIADLESKPYYLGIIKEYINGDPSSIASQLWSVRFTVKIKLPDVPGYAQVDALEREALRNMVEAAMTAEYKDLGMKLDESVARAEVAGIEEFGRVLGVLISGGILPSLFENAGFEILECDGTYEIEIHNDEYSNADGIDYAGITEKNSTQKIIDLYQSAQLQTFTHMILTSNKSINAQVDYTKAQLKFNSVQRKIVCWVHFQEIDGKITMLRNVKSNLTSAEAETYFNAMVDARFANYQASYDIAKQILEGGVAAKGDHNAYDNRNGCIAGQYSCAWPSFAFNWFAATSRDTYVKEASDYSLFCCNVVPFEADAFYNDYSSFLSISYPSYQGTLHDAYKAEIEYKFGLLNGVGEGVKEIAVFAYGIAFKFGRHVPTNGAFWADIVEKIAQNGIAKGAGVKLSEDWEYLKELWNSVSEIVTNLGTILPAVWNSIVEGAKDAAFINGVKAAGYMHGYVIFVIALEIVTTGSSTFVQAGKFAVKTCRTATKNIGQTVRRLSEAGGVKGVIREWSDDAAKAVSNVYLDNLARFKQLFKKGKVSELFSELKKTSAFPKMGKTRSRNYTDLLAEYKAQYGQNASNYPYSTVKAVTDFELAQTGYFVRVYSGNSTNSSWVFRIEDLRQYKNVDEIVEALALPSKPTKIGLAELPEGTNLRKSTAGPQNWANGTAPQGGGFQYEILSSRNNNWFKPLFEDINDFFK
jgi:hypothetical protein